MSNYPDGVTGADIDKAFGEYPRWVAEAEERRSLLDAAREALDDALTHMKRAGVSYERAHLDLDEVEAEFAALNDKIEAFWQEREDAACAK